MNDLSERVFDSYTLDEGAWRKGRNLIAGIAVAGWAACALAWRNDPVRFSAAYLVGFAFFLTIALGSLFFVMLAHLTGSAWSVTMRRIAENVMFTIPAGAVLFLPVAFCLGSLYEWARPVAVAADPLLQIKAAFLNPRFFFVRAAVYFALWSFWALRLYWLSTSQDESGSLSKARSAERWSAPGILMLTLTVVLASFDWLMSLDPHWYSTMFGFYIYSGAGLAFFAALALILLAFRSAGVLRHSVNHEHYHDLGKWIFGLTVFWAYIAFSQYMLIWYANLPEETVWFRDRLVGKLANGCGRAGHRPLFRAVPGSGFAGGEAAPEHSRSGGRVGAVDALHRPLLDYDAGVLEERHRAELDGPGCARGCGWDVRPIFWSRLRRRALAPMGDIRFERSLEFTNVF